MPEIATSALVRGRPRTRAAAVLTVRNVSAHAPNGRRLLDDVSLDVARGEMLAIVGPTGAGKTSLARAITGSLALDDGEVRVDGRVAFVPQEDALHAGLALKRALTYAAGLRLPDTDADERAARVHSVLEELGLTAHADTTIRDLSGGQRKRASIAAVLLGEPDVLVLDEPTAGLDPGYEKVVLDTLRALATNGRTVITVTHSVDALHACDRVLFIAAGAVAFIGTPTQATRYFGKDLADVFLALDSAPHLWQQKFRAHQPETCVLSPTNREQEDTSSRGRGQFRLLLRRQIDVLRADRRHLLLLALQAPFVGALLWAVLPANSLRPDADGQFGSKAGVVLLFIVLSATWLGVANAIRDVVRERNILKWEAAAGLSARPYVLSKFAVLGALAVAQSVVVGFMATGRQDAMHRGELIALTALAGVAATALGLLISALAKSTDRASALLPVTLVAQLVLAGEWASSAHLPMLHQLRWVISTRWALEAMAATLNGPAAQRTRAVFALVLLTVFAVEAAMAAVTRRTRAAATPRKLSLAPRLLTAALPATGLAVALSLGAGGVGVFALTHMDGGAPPSPVARHLAAAPALPATTTPAPPVTEAPVVAAPPVTAAPVVKAVAPRPVTTTPVTEVPTAAAPDIVVPEAPPTTVPQVIPQPPAVTPTSTTPRGSNLGGLFGLFTNFSPKMGRR
jgi:ABC-type multidrug transport system ATPase subunit